MAMQIVRLSCGVVELLDEPEFADSAASRSLGAANHL